MNITIIGTGYVGLVTGAIFADLGYKVFCVDINEEKIQMLSKGIIPFYEPGLEEIIKRNVSQKRLFFTTSYKIAVPTSKIIFFCVGTPPTETGEADLSHLQVAITETAKHLKGYTLLAIKSTIPIGAEENLYDLISKSSKSKFEFASCPEFLREGSAVEDTKNPDRIVIGVKSKKAANILLDLYKHFNGQRIVCDIRSAQMIKYAANTFLATKLSFANAIANLSERLNTNAETVLQGIGLDKRIGCSFLKPSGVGFGGSCFPKDLLAFINISEKAGYDFDLLKAVDRINKLQIDYFINKIKKTLGELKNKKIAILGLAFKANTDDIRESPAIKIIYKLLAAGVKVCAYDPAAIENTKKVFGSQVDFTDNAYKAVSDTNAMLVMTEWNEFKELDLDRIKKLMAKPIIIDGRNIYDPVKVKNLGFTYIGVGRN